jgi:hypothetical protein
VATTRFPLRTTGDEKAIEVDVVAPGPVMDRAAVVGEKSRVCAGRKTNRVSQTVSRATFSPAAATISSIGSGKKTENSAGCKPRGGSRAMRQATRRIFHGAMIDITERKRNEGRFRRA